MEHPVLLSTLLGISDSFRHVFYTWCAMALLFGLGLFARSRLRRVPSGLQNVLEVIIGGLEQFTVDTIGEKGRRIFPLLCGIFLFILVQNLFGLIPFLDAPTANVNTNAAMALSVFCYYHYVGLRAWGPGYIRHFLGPILPAAPLMLPIELVSHAARPISLTLRLFGNIRGEEIVLLLAFTAVPLLTTLPAYCLFLLVKVLQAFVFYMLAMLYLQGAMEHPPH